MKKVVFVINNLEIGGVQISLLNLIREIYNFFDITVLTFYYKKEYELLLPKNVKLIHLNSPIKYLGVSQNQLKNKPLKYCTRAFWATLTKIFGRSFITKFMFIFQKKIGYYDYAISYLHEGGKKIFYGGCNEFVIKKIKADKKVAWIHCDFKLSGGNNNISRKIYKKFDSIIACSNGTKKTFLECFPEFKGKCIAIRNCIDYEKIKCCTKSKPIYDCSDFNIVTIARLAGEKGIERAIYAIEECLKKGFKVKYHIIGTGIMESLLKEYVDKNQLGDYIIFYGSQSNPYQFLLGANLFLLTSYHEAAPMVFDEAAFLKVPILATNTISTEEMLIKTKYGIVCDNNQEGINSTLLYILENPQILDEIKQNLNNSSFTNEFIVNSFCKLFK